MILSEDLAGFHDQLRAGRAVKADCTTAVNRCLETGRLFEAVYILDAALQQFPTSRYYQRWVASLLEAMDQRGMLEAVREHLSVIGGDLSERYDRLTRDFTKHHGPDAARPGSKAFLRCVVHKNMSVGIAWTQPIRNVLSRIAEHYGRVSAGEAFGVPAAPSNLSLGTAKIGIGARALRYRIPNAVTTGRFRYFYLHEPGLLRLISRFRADDVFLDIGANVGSFAIAAAVMRECRVVAIEPFSVNHEELTRNIALNGVGDRVTPLRAAISDETADGALSYTTGYIGAANLVFDSAGAGEAPASGGVEQVRGYRLDDLVADGSIAFPNHIKIDVDGAEHRIIAGMARTLTDPRLRSIRLEIRLDDPGNARALQAIENAGFVCRVDDDMKNLLCLRDDGFLTSRH